MFMFEQRNKYLLSALAIAPPAHLVGQLGDGVLAGADPASLYNACRLAALKAKNKEGAWGQSHWSESRAVRKSSVMLLDSIEQDLPLFENKLRQLRPNLLLIGSMTLCFPGAVACAKRAKEILGDEVCIVLGGRQPNETFYIDKSNTFRHHEGSPLKLMKEHDIPQVFDIVVSGEGEGVIVEIGEQIAELKLQNRSPVELKHYLHLLIEAEGKFIVGTLINDEIVALESVGKSIDYNALPAPCSMFGISASFDIFDGRPTAHVFSDLSQGCIYDCSFCSERRSIVGPLKQIKTGAQRLFNQFKAADEVVKQDYGKEYKASAFIEDSTILAGSKSLLKEFNKLMRESELDVRFGGQFTVDQIADRIGVIKEMTEIGLEYLFIGIETFDPNVAAGMSKNTKIRHESWVVRSERALLKVHELGIKTATALVFGLGESHENRLALINVLGIWREQYGFPQIVSLNWGVQHPLQGDDGGDRYKYIEWGIPAGPFVEAFENYGEASILYPVSGVDQPILEEVLEINRAIKEMLKIEVEQPCVKKPKKSLDIKIVNIDLEKSKMVELCHG
jgi:B12-binding domain/radical SAM domain protein